LFDGKLKALPAIHVNTPDSLSQTALNQLDAVLDARTSMYLLLRRKGLLMAITYVPFQAKQGQREFLLEHRHDLVRQLGEENFSQSLICKEVGEITDARSWDERDRNDGSHGTDAGVDDGCKVCEDKGGVKDLGYRRNECRLCDRRMKNKITPEALEALTTLSSPGTTVQCVSIDTHKQ
jgi:twinfilin-like protein